MSKRGLIQKLYIDVLLEFVSTWEGGFGEDVKTHIAYISCYGLAGTSTFCGMNCEQACAPNHNTALGE